jgi:hypothetical protein
LVLFFDFFSSEKIGERSKKEKKKRFLKQVFFCWGNNVIDFGVFDA